MNATAGHHDAVAAGTPPFELILTERCAAPPEVVYDLLANVGGHAGWGGERQTRLFRLTGIDAPEGPAGVGTRFRSTGRVFLVYRTWDESTVTVADRPRALAFVTEDRYVRRCEGTYENRYDITPDGGGCVVTYTFRRLRLVRPPLHMRGPMRRGIERFGAPRFFGRGFRNLLRQAERAVV